jgi:hypothetical protein
MAREFDCAQFFLTCRYFFIKAILSDLNRVMFHVKNCRKSEYAITVESGATGTGTY